MAPVGVKARKLEEELDDLTDVVHRGQTEYSF